MTSSRPWHARITRTCDRSDFEAVRFCFGAGAGAIAGEENKEQDQGKKDDGKNGGAYKASEAGIAQRACLRALDKRTASCSDPPYSLIPSNPLHSSHPMLHMGARKVQRTYRNLMTMTIARAPRLSTLPLKDCIRRKTAL